MQDQEGFPLDAAYEECHLRGLEIDWLEALADCWLSSPLGFDSFTRQAALLTGIDLCSKFKDTLILVINANPSITAKQEPLSEACHLVLKEKRNER